MSSKNSETPLKDRIDWITVIVPFLAILALCVCFILMPDASKSVLDTIRFILGDTFGLFYLAVGLFVFLLSLFLAFSRLEISASESRMRSRNTRSSCGPA